MLPGRRLHPARQPWPGGPPPAAAALSLQVKELGAVISNCSRLARDLEKTFQTYWVLGAPKAVLPKRWPHNFSSHINHFQPLRARFDGVPTTAYFSVRGAPRPRGNPAPPWPALQSPQRLPRPQGDRGASKLARLWSWGRGSPAVPGDGPSSRDRWPGRCLGDLQTVCQVGSRGSSPGPGRLGEGQLISAPVTLWGWKEEGSRPCPSADALPSGSSPPAKCLAYSRDLVSGQGCGPRRGVALSRCETLPGTGGRLSQGSQGQPLPPPLQAAPLSASWIPNPGGVQNRGSALRDLSPKQASPPQLCPQGRTRDLDALLAVMGAARQFIYASVMDYFPTTRFSHPARWAGREPAAWRAEARSAPKQLLACSPACQGLAGPPSRQGPGRPEDLDLPLPQVLASAGQRAAGGGLWQARGGASAGQLWAQHGPPDVSLPAVPAGLQQPRGQYLRGRGEDPLWARPGAGGPPPLPDTLPLCPQRKSSSCPWGITPTSRSAG